MAPHAVTETGAQWLQLVEKGLGGRPVASLAARIEPGIVLDPLIAAGHAPPVWSRGGRAWTRMQRLDGGDAAAVDDALEAGAEGFEIVVQDAPIAWRGGLAAEALETLLAGVAIDRVALRLAPGDDLAATRAIDRVVAGKRLDPALLDLSFGLDPIGALARDPGRDFASRAPALLEAVRRLAGRGYRGPLLSADARIVHAAGGGPTRELAYALGGYVALLRLLLDAGVADGMAIAALDVALAADADPFVTIAKFRAMRLLQARALGAAGLPPFAFQLHAETAWSMLTIEDEGSNVVRATIAALAAALGGGDSISVLPHRAAGAPGDREAARVALTTQAILAGEARLGAIDDPTAGSGTVERLTLALAEAAWSAFQAIEREGGLPASIASGSLASGSLASGIAADRAADRARLAAGEAAIVGVTLYRADGAPAPQAAEAEAGPFEPRRRAAPFERPSA